MNDFDSLITALEGWFDIPLCDLPEELQQRVKQDFSPMPWDDLTTDERRSVAHQKDYQNDPAMEDDRQFWWDFFVRMDDIKRQIEEWKETATPTASDLAQKEARLAELGKELARMEQQERKAYRRNYPEHYHAENKGEMDPASSSSLACFIAYPKALNLLVARLGSTPEELAAWVWIGPGPDYGGLAAYLNANELTPPPRFYYDYIMGEDYLSPLMACWFKEDEITNFQPADRYITGKTLIERWSEQPGIVVETYIQAKIAESRLVDYHPTYGGTQGSNPHDESFPALETGLFVLSDVKAIEKEDFDDEHNVIAGENANQQKEPVIGSPEWRRQNARKAANARHDKPGGSRDKQRQIREIWATGKYSSRDICAEQECAALDMSFTAARKALRKTPKPKTT